MLTSDILLPHQAELPKEAQISIVKLHVYYKLLRPALDEAQKMPKENIADAVTAHTDIQDLKKELLVIFKEADFTQALSSIGIPMGSSFADETIRIIKGKILPYLHHPREASTIIHQIFDDKNDHIRIENLRAHYLKPGAYFTTEEKQEILAVFSTQVINAINIISYRIAALGMDEDVYTRAGKDDALITPFLQQNHEINELLENIEQANKVKIEEDLAQNRIIMRQCLQNIALIDKGAEKNGTSLRQTYLLRKLELLIVRLESLLPVICYDDTDKAFDDLISLLFNLACIETKPKKLRYFISRNINLIAYRITENKRKTGEHYVASDNSEYLDLFISACGGGFIVSFMVLIKLAIHDANFPVFWEGLLYSLNYATGFVIIQMLHFTLATKQPAMTAAFLAASLDHVKDDSTRYNHLAATVAKVSRSQLASFAGNLIVVFPCTLLWIFALGKMSYNPLVSTESANDLLLAVHPLYSLSFWYASIAGVFLFLAGIISGFGDNKVVVSNIGLRIEAHPFLKKMLSVKHRSQLASYIEKNLGPLLGNITLGFMMGMAGFFGKITGVPFEIRHITFSTGNIAVGFYASNINITVSFVFAILSGIFIIGFFNFVVSFFLALQVAVRSRGLKLSDYPKVLAAIAVYFKNQPAEFFFPKRTPKTEVAPR